MTTIQSLMDNAINDMKNIEANYSATDNWKLIDQKDWKKLNNHHQFLNTNKDDFQSKDVNIVIQYLNSNDEPNMKQFTTILNTTRTSVDPKRKEPKPTQVTTPPHKISPKTTDNLTNRISRDNKDVFIDDLLQDIKSGLGNLQNENGYKQLIQLIQNKGNEKVVEMTKKYIDDTLEIMDETFSFDDATKVKLHKIKDKYSTTGNNSIWRKQGDRYIYNPHNATGGRKTRRKLSKKKKGKRSKRNLQKRRSIKKYRKRK